MIRISLCMIVRDEQEVIGRCLDSVKDIADEIIIVDTGSVDHTKEIVSRYTDKIYDFKWVDDFSKARNYSFSKATGDYILWLDADDVILPEDAEEWIRFKNKSDTTVDMYVMPYIIATDEKGKLTTVTDRERLMKRSKNYQWIGPVHEVIIQDGEIQHLDIRVTHKKEKISNPYRNVNIFRKMIEDGKEFDVRQEYCYAKELVYIKEYREAIERFESYIEKYASQYQENKTFLYPAFLELADCYSQISNLKKEIETLLRVLKYEIPEAECCCKIGIYFYKEQKYKLSIFWFELALKSEIIAENEWHANKEYRDFIPLMYLGLCYYNLFEIEKAIQYNERAGNVKLYDSTYLANKKIYLEANK